MPNPQDTAKFETVTSCDPQPTRANMVALSETARSMLKVAPGPPMLPGPSGFSMALYHPMNRKWPFPLRPEDLGKDADVSLDDRKQVGPTQSVKAAGRAGAGRVENPGPDRHVVAEVRREHGAKSTRRKRVGQTLVEAERHEPTDGVIGNSVAVKETRVADLAYSPANAVFEK